MRKLITLLTMMLLCIGAQASIYLGSTELKDGVTYSSSNLSGISSGSITANYSQRTITLNALKADLGESYGLAITKLSTSTWTLTVKGTCSISLEGAAIYTPLDVINQNLIVKGYSGDGTDVLTLQKQSTGIGGNYKCIHTDNAQITFKDLKLNFTSPNGSVMYGEGSDIIRFEGVDATLSPHSGLPAMNGFGNVIIADGTNTTPSNLKWDASKTIFTLNGERYNGTITLAVKDYDLTVKGHKVTGRNASDVLGDGAVACSIIDNVVTLDLKSGTYINTTWPNAIVWGNSHTTLHRIRVAENVTLISDEQAINNKNTGKLEIIGSGSNATLKLTSSRVGCICSTKGDLSLSNLNLTASTSGDYGISSNEKTTLTINNCYMKVTATKRAIVAFKNVVMTKCYTPNYEHFDPTSTRLTFVDEEGTNAITELEILKGTAYPIKVSNTRVTEANKDDILGGNSGISFSNTGWYTLTFEDCYLSCINNAIRIAATCDKDVMLIFKGTNALTSKTEDAITSLAKVAIYIEGEDEEIDGKRTSLTLGSDKKSAIGMAGGNLRFSDIDGQLYNKASFVSTIRNDGSATLSFDDTGLTIENSNAGLSYTHSGFVRLNTYDCYLKDSYFDYGKNRIVNLPNNSEKKVIVQRGYGLEVAGIEITEDNRHDIMNDDGSAYYDPDARTLYLDNFSCSGVAYGIRSHSPLQIVFTGENSIKASVNGILNTSTTSDTEATTISGEGSLTVDGGDLGIFTYGGLRLKNDYGSAPSIYVSGNEYGICGYNGGASENLVIDNVELVVYGNAHSAICDFKSIKCYDAELIAPAGCKMGTAYGNAAVVDQDGKVVPANPAVVIGQLDQNQDCELNIVDIATLIEKIKTRNCYFSLLPVLVDKVLHYVY